MPEIKKEFEPWMCVECYDDPERGWPPNFAGYGDDEDICGYHYGIQKGYINPSDTGDNSDGGVQ